MKKLMLILIIGIFFTSCEEQFDWQDLNNNILYINDDGVSARYMIENDSISVITNNLEHVYMKITIDDNIHENLGEHQVIPLCDFNQIDFYISGIYNKEKVIINTRRSK